MIIAAILVFIVISTILKYYENRWCIACYIKGRNFTSFVLGATVVAIFGILFNEIYQNIHNTNNYLVLLIAFVFAIFLFIEHHIYHHRSKKSQKSEQGILITSLSSLSGFIVGIIAASNMQPTILQELIFLGTLLSYDVIDGFSLHAFHKIKSNITIGQKIKKMVFSVTPILGFLIAYYMVIPEILNVILLIFFGGSLFYILMREFFSYERKPAPWYFLAGVTVFTMILAILI